MKNIQEESMDEQTKQKRKDIVGWVIYIAVLLAIIITFRCFFDDRAGAI